MKHYLTSTGIKINWRLMTYKIFQMFLKQVNTVEVLGRKSQSLIFKIMSQMQYPWETFYKIMRKNMLALRSTGAPDGINKENLGKIPIVS